MLPPSSTSPPTGIRYTPTASTRATRVHLSSACVRCPRGLLLPRERSRSRPSSPTWCLPSPFRCPILPPRRRCSSTASTGGKKVACIQSQVSNGKTANVLAVQYVAAGVAGAALVLTGASAVSAALSGGAASGGGAGTISPSFTEVFGWFQGMAMNGMLSVNYPPIYRSFAKNFAFSTGVIPWTGLQTSIDNFRAKTGGNLTEDNVAFLKNATLIFPDGSTNSPEPGSLEVQASARRLRDPRGPRNPNLHQRDGSWVQRQLHPDLYQLSAHSQGHPGICRAAPLFPSLTSS